MKSIKEFITESQKPSDYKDKVNEVINLGKEKGLKVVFRDRPMNTGDFCFFIYDKKKQDRYLVGYDGNWKASNTPGDYDFDYCLGQTKKFINNYK
jgi:hypothetical protein